MQNNIITYSNGQKEIKVVTYKQIAEAFNCEINSLQKNFSRNKERFVDNEDYFKLNMEEIRVLTNSHNLDIPATTTVMNIFTEKGLLKHMKMIGTDEAWQGYDILIDTYFKAKELALPSYQIDNPIERAKVWIKEQETYINQLESAKEIIEEKEEIIIELEPKAEKFDTFISTDGVQPIANVAKTLGLGRNNLYTILRNGKILMKNNLPYQKYIDSGYFRVKQSIIQRKTTSLVKQQTFVTTKGINFIYKCLKSQQLINVTRKLFW